jgi:ribonuclease HI/predicted kinase
MSKKFDCCFWTDGSYRPSKGTGGIGVIEVIDGNIVWKHSEGFTNTTNNKMEMRALMIALEQITEQMNSVIIYSDSQYCLGCINKNWKREKNIEMWKEFDETLHKAHQKCKYISFRYTKGHDEDEFNNLVDKLATEASASVAEVSIDNIDNTEGLKVILCRGIQGSGKTTWAKNYCANNPKTIRVNRDDIRALFCQKWSREFEEIVKHTELQALQKAIVSGYSVVIDDVSNMNSYTVKNIKAILPDGVEITYQDFFDVSLEECIERDSKREHPIGEEIIRNTYERYKDIIDKK